MPKRITKTTSFRPNFELVCESISFVTASTCEEYVAVWRAGSKTVFEVRLDADSVTGPDAVLTLPE
ncbi:hypothetical protein GCM10009020_02970 [Natronoarchaeum mannanilyticum]|uniref:Uncharacterized protein n=1 Tax=Natronoarchaeum mannanilyticum TaxID=926360 RepID=A0AAV3T4C1_9EURY